MPPLELAERLGLALALAIFLGLAFEEVYKREERVSPGGIRTFPILAVSGATLYLIEPQYALAFVAGLLALGAWLFAHVRIAAPQGRATGSLMIPASNLLAYVIGPISLSQPPWVAVAVSVTAVLLLGARERMHRLVQLVPRDELMTAGKFLILVGVILPLVPDRPIMDVTPLTPYRVWLAVIAVSGLSYASYLAQRYGPSREGVLLPAVLGGLYSSTATTVVLAKRQRAAGAARPDLAAGIVASTAVMYLRLDVIIAIFDARFAWMLAPALIALFAAGAAMAAYQWRKAVTPAERTVIPATNPLELPAAVVFAAVFVVISIVTGWAGTTFGEKGVVMLAAAAGATDIDPFVLSIAQGGVPGVPIGALAAAVIVAASTNNAVKAALAAGFGGFAATRLPAAMLLVLALFGFAAAASYAL